MRFTRVSLIAAALLMAVAPMLVPPGAAEAEEVAAEAHDNEIMVRFKDGATTEAQAAALAQGSGVVVAEAEGLGIKLVKVQKGSAQDAVKRLSQDPSVERAEINAVAYASEIPNDNRFPELWGMHNVGQVVGGVAGTSDADIDAPQAWDTTKGSLSTRIAILDTGINAAHPDLAPKVLGSLTRNFSSSSSSTDLQGHGTHVAGTAAARINNVVGVAGVCPNCTLVNVKVLGDNGRGSYFSIIRGILYVANCETFLFCGTRRAQVINMSLGGSTNSFLLEQAVNRARDNGVLLACAAGNDNTSTRHFPAAYSNCISVSATNNRNQRASFSNFGATVDVAAPGQSILSTSRTGLFEFKSGTSMATPHVAGLAGLLFSRGLSAGQARIRIESRTDAIPGGGGSRFGKINACKAVRNTRTCPGVLPPITLPLPIPIVPPIRLPQPQP